MSKRSADLFFRSAVLRPIARSLRENLNLKDADLQNRS